MASGIPSRQNIPYTILPSLCLGLFPKASINSVNRYKKIGMTAHMYHYSVITNQLFLI